MNFNTRQGIALLTITYCHAALAAASRTWEKPFGRHQEKRQENVTWENTLIPFNSQLLELKFVDMIVMRNWSMSSVDDDMYWKIIG